MASFRFYLLSAVVCSVLVVGQGLTTPRTEYVDVSTAETTQKPETTTEPETTTPSTTTTTTPATTTSTTPSTTTSTTPSTTSTTPSTTTSTTPSTTTSTQAPPSPTPKPGPPEMGTWTYPETNKTCIVVQFAAQLNVTYPKANVTVGSSSVSVGVKQVNVPANATVVSGSCGNTTQSLTLSWPATVDKNNTLTILFQKNGTNYELKSLNVTLVPSIFPNISNVDAIDLYHGVEWQTPLATSYRCAAATKLTMTTAEPVNVAATLTLAQLQEEAFRTATGTGFSAARDCAGGDIPDAVPIAVGCALGGMVVVVLIAYLVARRRSAARGYLSM